MTNTTIQKLAIEKNLSNDAKHFLRCNPAAQDNILVMQALSYMDDCLADSEDVTAEELEKETDKASAQGEKYRNNVRNK